MLFWILASALALLILAYMTVALLRARDGAAATPAEAFDLKVYRDQLAEVDRDSASGKLPEEEAARLRVEISRRILAADAKLGADQATVGQSRATSIGLTAAMALVLIGGGAYAYMNLGAPGYADMPLQWRKDTAAATLRSRPGQLALEAQIPPAPPVEASPDYVALVDQLRKALDDRPDDVEGFTLLSMHEAKLGNFRASYEAQARIIDIKGDAVTVRELTNLADMMVIAAGGRVSPEAQAVLERALARDPKDGVARFYAGLMMAQTGRPDVSFRMWDALLRSTPPDAPWQAPIRQQIEELAFRAGVQNYTVPTAGPVAAAPNAPGPSADDIEAAQEMTPQERMDMIRGMVSGLSDRLATEGGAPQEWARLINALGVLGEIEQASAIYDEAKVTFAQDETALATLAQAAQNLGLTD